MGNDGHEARTRTPGTQDETRIDGVEVQTRRKALGLTQEQLAQRLDVAENTVWRWEHGEQKIAHPAMLKLALDALMMRHTQNSPAKHAEPS